MPAGLQIIGDNGSIQIDENYANLALRHQGSATASTSIGLLGSDTYKATITVTADTPLIAWRSTANPVALMGVSQSGGDWTFTFWAPQNTSFTYYVFDKPQPGGTGGIEVLDASGSRTFWSGYKYMRIASALAGADYRNALGNYTFTAGRSYAVCQAVAARIFENTYVQDPDSGDYEHEINRWGLAVKSITNGINLSEAVHQQYFEYTGPGISTIVERLAYSLLIIDVTNF